MVDRVNVYKSALHPRYGGRVGGAIEINSTKDLTIEPAAGVGINSLYGVGYAKTPIFNKKVGLAIGARRSLPVAFSSPKLDAISEMVYAATVVGDGRGGEDVSDFSVAYEDYNAKLEIPMANGSKFSFSGLYATTLTGYRVPDTAYVYQQIGFKNLGFNAQYISTIAQNIQSKASVTWSKYDAEFGDTSIGKFHSDNQIEDFRAAQQFDWANEIWDIEFGADYDYQQVSFSYKGVFGPNNNRRLIRDSAEQSASTMALFINNTWNGIDRLTIQAGARLTYYSLLKDLAILPRLNVNFDLTKNLIVKSSAGIYRQYLSQLKYLEFSGGGFDNELWRLASDNHNIIGGQQATSGFLWVKNKLVIDV